MYLPFPNARICSSLLSVKKSVSLETGKKIGENKHYIQACKYLDLYPKYNYLSKYNYLRVLKSALGFGVLEEEQLLYRT